MPASVTYTFVNTEVATATKINQNYSDLVDAINYYDGGTASATQKFLPPSNTTTNLENLASKTEGEVAFDTTTKQLKTYNGTAWISSSGDVSGPAASTDKAIARFNGTGGKTIQDYTSGAPTISDTGAITLAANAILKVDEINGNSTAGIKIKGRTDGVKSSAGYIGELDTASTGIRSGTGGFTYSNRSTTNPGTGVDTEVITLSLKKGTYIACVTMGGYSNQAATLVGNIRIGGTQVTTYQGAAASTTALGFVSFSLPLVIDTDDTIVSGYCYLTPGTPQAGQHEAWAIRLG